MRFLHSTLERSTYCSMLADPLKVASSPFRYPLGGAIHSRAETHLSSDLDPDTDIPRRLFCGVCILQFGVHLLQCSDAWPEESSETDGNCRSRCSAPAYQKQAGSNVEWRCKRVAYRDRVHRVQCDERGRVMKALSRWTALVSEARLPGRTAVSPRLSSLPTYCWQKSSAMLS